jgi:prophage regulatory protein
MAPGLAAALRGTCQLWESPFECRFHNSSSHEHAKMNSILHRLRIDIGQRTVGQLAQEREAAANEIERLMQQLQDARIDQRDVSSRSMTRETSVPQPTSGHHLPWSERAFLRFRDVSEIVGLSRSTIYKRIADGRFPKPAQLSENTVRWRTSDIVEWLAGFEKKSR